ncbi:unnamed protein product [Pelagomonas calceolata]|uniref:WW domain-containing protein n=1 Tax=Pelagomonas calceolata TaxID=35677 RepID=A0A7S3ZRR2_9STRA|nr:unnamed protein product [Pelagomonas calceolata]|mmetsp:Transcript_1051/g.2806  ORF Transcript_1051/g.2806 Transcript_1051/m.2806 type:complete len:921 (+) Transcript_1051:247-3009(+)
MGTRAEDAAMYAKSRKVTSGLNSAIRNLEKRIKDIDEISGELGYDMAYEKLLQQPEFADEAQARIDAEKQKMQRIRDVRRRKAEAYRKKKDAEEAAKKPAPKVRKKKKRRMIGAAGSGAVASRKLKERSEDAAQLVLGMENSNAEPLEAPAPIEVPSSPINVDDPLTQAFFSGEPPVPKRRPKMAQPKKTHYDRTRRPRSAAFRIIANDNPFSNVDELFAAEAERQKQQSDKMKRLASPWGILDSDPRAGRPSSAPHHRPKPLPLATLGKGASEVVETLRAVVEFRRKTKKYGPVLVSVGRKDSPRRRTYDDLHAQAPAPARGRPRRRKSAPATPERPQTASQKRLQERFDSLSRPKSAPAQRSPSPSSKYAPWDNSSGWDTILRRPVSPPPHQAPNPEGWCPNDKAFVHVTHEVTMLGGRKPLRHPVWIRVKITEVRESVNEVDERVVPRGMLILTCRTQRSRKLELPKEYWRPFDIDARRVVRKVPSELIDTGKRPPYRGKPIPRVQPVGPGEPIPEPSESEPEPEPEPEPVKKPGMLSKMGQSARSLSPVNAAAATHSAGKAAASSAVSAAKSVHGGMKSMHGGLKKGLGSMGSSMRNLGGSMSPPKMPSFKRPSSPFGRKSPTPVEEAPSEEPEVNERTVVFSPEPEAAPAPEPEPEVAPEPAAEPAIPETDETHLAAAKLQASVRGRNARKKTKRRKGPRDSAAIRQEIAELDEEGFREDAARNAQAAKIQARIRGRKARREAAPKRAALQRARADARALADKVAALEAENARLRRAASPEPAKTPNTEDDWEQCVDEATGHTYYYSSSRDASRWEVPSAWKEGGPKDDWEQCVTDEGHTYYFSASRNASVWDAPRAAKTPSDKRTPRRWTPSTQKRPTPAPRSPGTQLFAVPEAVTPSDDYESEAFDDYETPSK